MQIFQTHLRFAAIEAYDWAKRICNEKYFDWIRSGENNYNEKNIGEAIDGSLKRLKTDYIDLYQLHWPERSTNCFGVREFSINEEEKEWNNFESILQALDKYIKSGKIRHVGLSNETPYGLSNI